MWSGVSGACGGVVERCHGGGVSSVRDVGAAAGLVQVDRLVPGLVVRPPRLVVAVGVGDGCGADDGAGGADLVPFARVGGQEAGLHLLEVGELGGEFGLLVAGDVGGHGLVHDHFGPLDAFGFHVGDAGGDELRFLTVPLGDVGV